MLESILIRFPWFDLDWVLNFHTYNIWKPYIDRVGAQPIPSGEFILDMVSIKTTLISKLFQSIKEPPVGSHRLWSMQVSKASSHTILLDCTTVLPPTARNTGTDCHARVMSLVVITRARSYNMSRARSCNMSVAVWCRTEHSHVVLRSACSRFKIHGYIF